MKNRAWRDTGERSSLRNKSATNIERAKAGSGTASRSLNVLKKLEKVLNRKGFWPFLLKKIF
jgi:hypothetical protein